MILGNIINNKINFSTNVKNNKFNSYLAGLFEGDGHIWIQNPEAGNKKKHNPRFCITFSLKNEPLAKKLLDIIESGFIRYKPKDNACVLVVSPVAGLKKIVYLINGELRTPKIHQLYKLIDWLNKHHSTKIDKLPLKESPLANDSWLSGFIDSDGSFSVQHTKVENRASLAEPAKKRKISCRLRIEQRMLDPVTGNSYLDILTTITKFLNCSLLTRTQKSTSNEYYTLAASSKYSTEILVNYLDKYPLFSSKYLDYRDWREIVLLMLENKHYTEEGLTKTDSVRDSMNRNRTYFNWDHLNKLSA
uniref:LAGLIDADG endonuclease n=1 Tax=Fusarium napiforme TaxID=42672 RepID=A0A6M4AYX1_9HYPO|nr:LAGLIDADG endonuclease [Fusarium napiforme]